jgi:hypothetical protein
MKLTGPAPRRFTPAPGQYGSLLRASVPALMRLGSGEEAPFRLEVWKSCNEVGRSRRCMLLHARAYPVAACRTRTRSPSLDAVLQHFFPARAGRNRLVVYRRTHPVAYPPSPSTCPSHAPLLRPLAHAGALNYGYTIGLAPDDGSYAVATVAGRRVVESSMVGSFPRPAKPLILYEFNACPFCRKVGSLGRRFCIRVFAWEKGGVVGGRSWVHVCGVGF